ncbi:glycoside hydrolase family 26 protein [Bifidobacterium sp.]|jgi:mannan endo-1,4-beta-mannosidase|uniref:glycoside hydrolase family 26 protein n=1 Tax=Bifidobacterium sp. TaxID=41200 RepID=UPI0025B95896|nr:glycosyl hydrolase [Bifidobacterium sp.]MCI1634628.1 glycoside hydrolase family 26 protein [Bifidobacterium sp.]
MPVDNNLDELTQQLLVNLRKSQGQFAMFGHHDDLSCRRDTTMPSDVLQATGVYPAVFGFDFGGIEKYGMPDFDEQYFSRQRDQIIYAFSRGAVITMSWHSVNPVTGGGYGNNCSPDSVKAVLPGGFKLSDFNRWLDGVADFAHSLVDADEQTIPVVFRPLHEHNGDWFWWCIGKRDGQVDTDEAQFIELWQYIVSYLRDKRGVHNFLYANSPDRSCFTIDDFDTGYFRGYPGDDFVDIFGLDDYIDIGRFDNHQSPELIFKDFQTVLRKLVECAEGRNKVAAFTEVGTPNKLAGVEYNPWTGFLERAARTDEYTRKVLWYLAWRNSMTQEETNVYGTPLLQDATGADFREFSKGYIRFLDRIPNMYRDNEID